MKEFIEDLMPRTVDAMIRRERARGHYEYTYQSAASSMCSVSRRVENGSAPKEALLCEARVWDEKIEAAEEVVKTWQRDVTKNALVEGGEWLLIVTCVLVLAAPFFWM